MKSASQKKGLYTAKNQSNTSTLYESPMKTIEEVNKGSIT